VLSVCARAFSRTLESTCSDRGAFRILQVLTIRIGVKLGLLRPLLRSAGDLVPYSLTSGALGSITTRHFIDCNGLCSSHKIRYTIIWHVLSMSLYMYTYRDTGITEMDSVAGSIYFGDPGVDRHHLIKCNTHTILPNSCSPAFWPSFVDPRNLCRSSRSCQPFIDPRNIYGSSCPGINLYPLTHFLYSSSMNCSLL
jgi:hypothetical protein